MTLGEPDRNWLPAELEDHGPTIGKIDGVPSEFTQFVHDVNGLRAAVQRLGQACRNRECTKPLVLILDDFAMREHTAMHADDLYELISDRAVGKLTSSRRSATRFRGRLLAPYFTRGQLQIKFP